METIIKLVLITSSLLETFGAVMVGLIGTRGIPKPLEIIRAPNYKVVFWGWILMTVGFIGTFVSQVFTF